MPPPRIAGLAREPILTTSAVPAVKKDLGGFGVGYSGFGFGAWGFAAGSTGVAITPYAALSVPAAWACVKRLAEDVGKLPRIIRRVLPNGGMRVVRDHPLAALLRAPNRWQTPSQLWGVMTAWLALRGNAYAVVLRGPAGEPIEIVPLSPDRVSVMLSPSGDLYYQVNHPFLGFEDRRMHRDNIIHLKGPISFDGYTGISCIAAAQDGFGIAIAAQQHGATLFRQGAQMNGFIKHPAVLSREAKNYLSESLDEKFAGVQNAHRTPVLDEGMDFVKITMTSEDAQLLGTRQFSVVEVCRMFGVPPHKVHDLSNAHFSNIEQSEIAYRADTLLPIGIQMKEECGRVLLFEDEQADIEIDVDYNQLLRADRKTRFETYSIGVLNGIINRNEARIDDGMEPVPGGDEFRVPLNTGSPGATPAGEPNLTENEPSGGDNV